jgi:CubicO group peptidase (beta-lactamase class C family)
MRGYAAVLAEVQAGVGKSYPAAALSCGRGRVELQEALGTAQASTWFDLASLTKALCTSVLAMRLHHAGKLDLDEPVALPGAPAPGVRLWQLLAHCSGLPACPPPLWAQDQGLLVAPSATTRARVVKMAIDAPCGPAARHAVYSDLGFIVLGEFLEQRAGARLDEQLRPLCEALAAEVAFRPLDATAPPVAATLCAPTRRESPARELLVGQVHDDNARAMLGVAGHAGLFGTAAGVHRFAAALVDAYADAGTAAQRALGVDSATVRRFFARSAAAGLATTWGLGWDHPDPLPADGAPSTSSAGSLWPRTGVGHLGYTGCSLWLDLEARGVAVFLSNRVAVATAEQAAVTKAQLRTLRPTLHDAIQRAWRGAD